MQYAAFEGNTQHSYCLLILVGSDLKYVQRQTDSFDQIVSPFHIFCYAIAQRIQELEATLYNALQQETVIKFGELLSEKQQEELRTAVEKLRRQMLRKSREYDCQILQERMELLQQAHQVRFEVQKNIREVQFIYGFHCIYY